MKALLTKHPLRLFVLAYCVWQAVDLVAAWQSHSEEAAVWLVFCLWLIPALPLGPLANREDRPQIALLAAAVLLSFVGQVTWVHFLQYLALALAVVGWKQPLGGQWVWLLSSVLWTPACGWLVSRTLAGWETKTRIAVMAIVAGWLVWLAWSRSRRLDAAVRSTSGKPTLAPVWAALLFGLVGLSVTDQTRAEAIIYSPIQSSARPLGLAIDDKVQLAGSDTASQTFLTDALPSMRSWAIDNLHEGTNNSARLATGTNGLLAVDPSAIKLSVASDVRVYFVGEGAGNHNSLGFNTTGGGVLSGNPLLLFPDASSPITFMWPNNTGKRNASEPLLPGDFVNLGNLAAGTQLDFFLMQNAAGAKPGTNVYSTQSGLDPDHISHVVSFARVDSPYVLVGFEDTYNGAKGDYNDVMFAVYLGKENVQALLGVPAPEPGFLWLVVAGLGGWLYRVRRKKLAKVA